jgi:hypothetical protein
MAIEVLVRELRNRRYPIPRLVNVVHAAGADARPQRLATDDKL